MNEHLDSGSTEPLGPQQADVPTEKDRLRAAKHHGVGSDPENLDAEMEDPAQVGTITRPDIRRDDAGSIG